jgi:predicted metal-dependent enzyme (double-stranded beta helix superfamily)
MLDDISSSQPVYGVAEFVADVKQIVATDGSDPGPAGRDAIGQCMRRLAASDDIRARTGQSTTLRQGTHGMDIRGGEIHKEPNGTLALMLARFPHESATPVHNHNSWGVVCVVAGQDRYVAWERMDDGKQPGHADVRKQWEGILGPGDVTYFPEMPNDLHSQQGVEAPVWELVFFGRDPNVQPRLYFDPAAKSIYAAEAIRR